MKKFLTIFASLAMFAALASVAWQQYSAWQFRQDTQEAAQAPQGKLPTGVTPLHYTLALRIDPDKERFSGSVRIAVDIQRQQSVLWLHGKDIFVPDVRTEPTELVQQISDNIATDEQRAMLAEYLHRQYKPLLDELSLTPKTSADAANPVATQLLRERVLRLLALTLEQPDLLATLAERGKALIGFGTDAGFDRTAIDPQLHGVAMASAVIREGSPYFDQLMAMAYDSSDANFA